MRQFRYWLVSRIEGMGHWLFKTWGEERAGGNFPWYTKECWRRQEGRRSSREGEEESGGRARKRSEQYFVGNENDPLVDWE